MREAQQHGIDDRLPMAGPKTGAVLRQRCHDANGPIAALCRQIASGPTPVRLPKINAASAGCRWAIENPCG